MEAMDGIAFFKPDNIEIKFKGNKNWPKKI